MKIYEFDRKFIERDLPNYSKYKDLNGNPVKNNPSENPYGYDPYVIWKDNKEFKEPYEVAYSDRLMSWDFDKFNKCCMEVFGNTGQYFDCRTPEDIQRFLSMYFGNQIKLTAIMQGCNYGNGYPYWVFIYE